jgi:hypothetical protein
MVLGAEIRQSKVVTKDGKSLGKVANIVFSIDPKGLFGEAFLLVFPEKLESYLKMTGEKELKYGAIKMEIPPGTLRQFKRSRITEHLDWEDPPANKQKGKKRTITKSKIIQKETK